MILENTGSVTFSFWLNHVLLRTKEYPWGINSILKIKKASTLAEALGLDGVFLNLFPLMADLAGGDSQKRLNYTSRVEVNLSG